MLKIRRPLGRLIFNMGIAIPGKTVFLIETAPWCVSVSYNKYGNNFPIFVYHFGSSFFMYTEDNSGYGFDQWEKALHSNASSYWLNQCPEWSLCTCMASIVMCTVSICLKYHCINFLDYFDIFKQSIIKQSKQNITSASVWCMFVCLIKL